MDKRLIESIKEEIHEKGRNAVEEKISEWIEIAREDGFSSSGLLAIVNFYLERESVGKTWITSTEGYCDPDCLEITEFGAVLETKEPLRKKGFFERIFRKNR